MNQKRLSVHHRLGPRDFTEKNFVMPDERRAANAMPEERKCGARRTKMWGMAHDKCEV